MKTVAMPIYVLDGAILINISNFNSLLTTPVYAYYHINVRGIL